MSNVKKIAMSIPGDVISLVGENMRYSKVRFEQNRKGFSWVANFRRFKTGSVASTEFKTFEAAKENFLKRIK